MAVQSGPVRLGAPTLLPPPPAARQVCYGGDYKCPEGWTEVPGPTTRACPADGPCPTYEAACVKKSQAGGGQATPAKVATQITTPAKDAIQITLGYPPDPGGPPFNFKPFDRGHEECVWECPKAPDGTPMYPVPSPYAVPGLPVTMTCSPTRPTDGEEPKAEEWLGLSKNLWLMAGAGALVLALAGGIAVYAVKKKGLRPNMGDAAAFENYRLFHDHVNDLHEKNWYRSFVAWEKSGRRGPMPQPPEQVGKPDPSFADVQNWTNSMVRCFEKHVRRDSW